MTVALMKTTVETLTQVIGTTDFELLVKTVAVVMHRHIAMQSHAQVRTINPYINEFSIQNPYRIMENSSLHMVIYL